MRTNQEVLNIVVPHARLIIANPEKKRSVFKISHRDGDGFPCFIGALIPGDVEICVGCDNVHSLVGYNPNLEEYLCEDIGFLNDIQRTHDCET
jgi:hypothetical protein